MLHAYADDLLITVTNIPNLAAFCWHLYRYAYTGNGILQIQQILVVITDNNLTEYCVLSMHD